MANNDKASRDDDAAGRRERSESSAPYRASGSGDSYSPGANWARERAENGPGGAAPADAAGAPSGAGVGGFGPEGDFAGSGGQGAADVLGQAGGDQSGLVEEAQSRGPRKADRRFTGGEGVDEPDGRD